MLIAQTGAYLFYSERELARWVQQHGGGMSISGYTYSPRNCCFTDTHGSRLFLFVPHDINRGERHRGILFDRIDNLQPVDNEEMFTAWETLKVMVRPRPPVVPSGREDHDHGQELDTGSGEAPGGVTLAARSPAGRHHPQEQAEGGDRRGGRAAGAEAGQLGEDVGRLPKVVHQCSHTWAATSQERRETRCGLPLGHTGKHRRDYGGKWSL